MKVLFSNPPWWKKRDSARQHQCDVGLDWYAGVRAGSRWPHTIPSASRPDDFIFGGYLPYPFFMGYAATWVQQKTGAEVVFRDSIALRESYESYYRFIAEQRFDFIFFESATSSWDQDVDIIRRVSALSPGSRIVLTGPIATKGEAIFAQVPAVAVIQGEYEKGAQRVVEGQTGVLDYDLLTTEEMNASPFPYMDELIAPRYFDGISRSGGYAPPELQLWSSRGCPYKCIFCVWPAVMTGNDPDGTGRRKVRHYSPEYIEAYLRESIDRFGFRTVYFDDDTFNLGDRHVLGICEVMSRIGLPWAAMCRADTIERSTWQAMKDSGCFKVKIGYESGNQWVIDHIVNKRLDLEKARDTTAYLHQLGIKVHGTFTYGLPGETQEHMLDTKRYIASMELDTLQESGTAAFDGTPLMTLASQGKLMKYDGAEADAAYQSQSDGAEKMRGMGVPDVDAAILRSANYGRLSQVNSRLEQAWRRTIAKIRELVEADQAVAVWGMGTDFLLMMETFSEFQELLRQPSVRLVDQAWAGRTVCDKVVLSSDVIPEVEAVIVLTPRNPVTRTSMLTQATACGIGAQRIFDGYRDEWQH